MIEFVYNFKKGVLSIPAEGIHQKYWRKVKEGRYCMIDKYSVVVMVDLSAVVSGFLKPISFSLKQWEVSVLCPICGREMIYESDRWDYRYNWNICKYDSMRVYIVIYKRQEEKK